MSNAISGLINIAAFLGITTDEVRDAILFEHAPILVMDGEFYASPKTLTHWLTFGGNPDLSEPHPGRDPFVATAFDQANIVVMEKAS